MCVVGIKVLTFLEYFIKAVNIHSFNSATYSLSISANGGGFQIKLGETTTFFIIPARNNVYEWNLSPSYVVSISLLAAQHPC